MAAVRKGYGMLVLSRRIDQKIYVTTESGTEITVTIVNVSIFNGRPQVRIGFEAPKDVKIERDDSKDRIERNRKRRL